MSYRNPQQVVDTQSGQAFAELQKTISGTFAGVASAYKKEQATEAARLLELLGYGKNVDTLVTGQPSTAIKTLNEPQNYSKFN